MKILAITLALIGFAGVAQATETVAEKAQAASNDAARAATKTVHRIEEAACTEGDVKCLEEKAKHRIEEAKAYTKDKAAKIKNEMDDDAE